MKKVLKNFDNGKLSVQVTKIDQEEEIIAERPLNPDENFDSFHISTMPQQPTAQDNPNVMGTYTKNIGGFGITVTRKLR